MDPEMEFVLDKIANRYLDTDKVLRMFIKGDKLEFDKLESYVGPMLATVVVNQAAIIAYILKKEGHKGFPADVSVMQKVEDEGGDE
jgi:hypothetical protein